MRIAFLLSFTTWFTVACVHASKGPPMDRDPAASVEKSVDLKNLKVYQVTQLEQKLINEILKAGNLGQFEARVSIVDPVNDPYAMFESALRPIGGMLENIGVLKGKLTRYIPRHVEYYTREGHGLVTSCYLYLQQLKAPTDQVYVNSRQCNLTWQGIKTLPGGDRLTQYLAGFATIDENLSISNVRFDANERMPDDEIAARLKEP